VERTDLDASSGQPQKNGWAPLIVAAAFGVSGAVHLVHPQTFTPIVPKFMPAKRAVVYASGMAELLCAGGIWRRRRWAGTAAAVLLVAVWPANVQMAVDAQRGDSPMKKVAGWIRLPLQLPLIWCALQGSREPWSGSRAASARTHP
jgi:uncharacterized membrane protein